MHDIKELMKAMEKEIGKKKKADDVMHKIRKDLIAVASDNLRDEQILRTGVFQFEDSTRSGSRSGFMAWVSDFDDMKEIIEAYHAVQGQQITLVPREFDKTTALRDVVRIFPTTSGRMELSFGEDVNLPHLKALVKDYGIRVSMKGLDHMIANDPSYANKKWVYLREKLILSGMAEGLPMCDITGFADEYLDIEEQYARMLHQSFKKIAADLEIKEHKELQQDFDLLDLQSGVPLFLAMGRTVFMELRDANDGTETD